MAWYESLYDNQDEARARHAADQAEANQSQPLPYADGSFNDPRSSGRGY